MSDPLHPLGEEHLQKINGALDQIERAKTQVKLAKAAGINVADSERVIEEGEAKLRQIKQVYFPGR